MRRRGAYVSENNIAAEAGQGACGEEPGRDLVEELAQDFVQYPAEHDGSAAGGGPDAAPVWRAGGGPPAERAIRRELEYQHGGPWRCRCTRCKELVTAYAAFIGRFEPFEWFITR